MTYCVASPAEMVTVAFWKRLCEFDWAVCSTETVALHDGTADAILAWLTARLEYPVAGMTIGHFHLFIETFSRALGHPVPVVGPKFLSTSAASNPTHTRLSISMGEGNLDEFVSLLGMTETEQKAALFGTAAQVTAQVTAHVDVPAERPREERAHDPGVHHRASRGRRSAKSQAALDRQGQSADSRQPTDDAADAENAVGSGRN